MDKQITAYTILGKYDILDDLIEYNSKLVLPQIVINIKTNDDSLCEVYPDIQKGFRITTQSNYQIIDAVVTTTEKIQCSVSVDEAKLFIISNYDAFKPYEHIPAEKFYYPDNFQDEERFLNLESS